jgi:tRNA threonylcarbamoyl adenosine modification protein (Sua5/YciO/YrdC/YwlC family)
MGRLLQLHTQNPERRLLEQVAAVLRDGGVIIYPTDSCYALGCKIGDKDAQERIRRLRQLDARHNFTLVCRDLSQLATYARVDNPAYRLMKSLTPGPYTFLLRATHEVPRRLQNPKRKTIGLRVPNHRVTRALLERHGEPIMSSTLILPGEDLPLNDPEVIMERLGRQVDLVVGGGNCGLTPTTVIDLAEGEPRLLRIGSGSVEMFAGTPAGAH